MSSVRIIAQTLRKKISFKKIEQCCTRKTISREIYNYCKAAENKFPSLSRNDEVQSVLELSCLDVSEIQDEIDYRKIINY